jgi:hypothetical protein
MTDHMYLMLCQQCELIKKDNPDSYVYSVCNDKLTYINDEKIDTSAKWLVLMQKLDSTITNENREDLIDKNNAEYRANKLKVIKIIDVNDPSNTKNEILNKHEVIYPRGNIFNALYNTEIEYKVGKNVESEFSLKCDINECRTAGIKFYKTLYAAYYSRDIPDIYTGYWVSFRDDGWKSQDGEYLNGKRTDNWTYYNHPKPGKLYIYDPNLKNYDYFKMEVEGTVMWCKYSG